MQDNIVMNVSLNTGRNSWVINNKYTLSPLSPGAPPGPRSPLTPCGEKERHKDQRKMSHFKSKASIWETICQTENKTWKCSKHYRKEGCSNSFVAFEIWLSAFFESCFDTKTFHPITWSLWGKECGQKQLISIRTFGRYKAALHVQTYLSTVSSRGPLRSGRSRRAL